jgi:hypothetical protein
MKLFYSLLFLALAQWAQAQDFSKYTWSSYNQSNSKLDGNHVRDVAFDKSGTPWVVTGQGGLFHFDGKDFVRHSPLPNAETNEYMNLNDIAFDAEGNLLIAGDEGLFRIYNPKTKTFSSVELPDGTQSRIIIPDGRGGFVIGGNKPGLQGRVYYWYKKELTLITSNDKDVFNLYLEPSGDLLVFYRESYVRIPKTKKNGFDASKMQILGSETIYDGLYDKNNRFWVSSFDHLAFGWYNDTSFAWVNNQPDNMKTDWNGKFKTVPHRLLLLPDGWVGLSTQTAACFGVYNHDTQKWESYPLPSNDGHNGVERMVLAPDGSIWFCTWSNGISVFKPKQK